MKEETQEAAELYAEPYRCPKTADTREYCKHDIISAFNNGAKWQAERMYSEEDLKEAYKKGYANGQINTFTNIVNGGK